MADEQLMSIKEDEEHECKEKVLLRYFLQEWEIVKSLLDEIIANEGVTDPSSVNKIRSIMDKYQEQGQLLEPYLDRIISPLMHMIRTKTAELETSSNNFEIIKPLCIIIYTAVNVCGYKAVIKFFPHQVSDLEPAVSLLERCPDSTTGTSLRQESTGEMETKCVILLWLYILVLIPFDMSSVDTSIANCEFLGVVETPPLVMKILTISKDYLSCAGPMRRMAGLLLSRFLTRPDMTKVFIRFMDWAHERLCSIADDIVDHFRVLGIVEALASIFKIGSRNVLLNAALVVWNDISTLIKSSMAARSPLLRKLLVKLSARVGLTYLPHRYPTWRYVITYKPMGQNIITATSHGVSSIDDDHHVPQGNDQEEEFSVEEEMDVPEIIEDIIELLISSLRDTDTVVRWSAAKGIGRITMGLTSSLADEVLTSILELFSPGEGDGSWHGGCLAMAELSRRGLLLPASLPEVIPVIIKALHFDVRRGPHSIGSHVRDAAAYVCWAFGRAYNKKDMEIILEQLAPHLLMIACYDREVNCRRAAGAAFQENVGRQGNFPHGIDIVNSADYFSLSSRVNSYLHVAVSIAQYKEYLHSFVEELLYNKICHWDKGLRELAAEGLSCLVKYEPEYFGHFVLEKLMPCTLSSDLCTRHGAVLAIGELVLALHRCHFVLSAEKQKTISGVIPAIEKARLYRGKGGEIMRLSVSRFIECISLAHISLPEKAKRSLLDTLNENLRHPNSQIQSFAAKALMQFISTYLLSLDDASTKGLIDKYLAQLMDPNVAARRGSALAIGVLPFEYLVKTWRDVLRKLCSSCMVEDDPDNRDVEARVNAVRGLVSVCETLTSDRKDLMSPDMNEYWSLFLMIKNDVMQTLLKALDDYSVDNRGDVGSWVREAAMNGLERCTYILCENKLARFEPVSGNVQESGVSDMEEKQVLFDISLATSLMGSIMKQAVEKIDKIREMAAKILQRILHNDKVYVPFISHREKLDFIFTKDLELKWTVPSLSYPRLVQLLELNCYSKKVLSGLVISVGGLQDSLRKAALASLLDYLQVSETDESHERSFREKMLFDDLLFVLEEYQKCDRVIIPTFKTIDSLFNKKAFRYMKGDRHGFITGLLASLAIELKGSKDFTKLCTSISILGSIASLPQPGYLDALFQLLSFLGHRYPKIRRASSEQAYITLLQGNHLPGEKITEALEILAETCWESDIQEARNQRMRIYETCGLETRTLPVIKEKVEQTAQDENESYSALVGSSGF